METNRLKIKIGEHEFEAEGPTDTVQAQFAAFKELVLAAAAQVVSSGVQAQGETAQAQNEGRVPSVLTLEKIMRQDGRVISLTVRAGSLPDAILLVVLGQKVMRNNDSITGGEILDGLKQSGQAAGRIDRYLDKMAADGYVIKIGVGRASRYRITNQGRIRAEEIAKGAISLVA